MEAVRPTRREREKLNHRKQILSDALELFTKKGFHNVSMNEIAARTEFSIGTLYKLFKSKEELYGAIMIEKAEEAFNVVDEVLSADAEVENIVRNYIDAKIGIFKENLPLIRLLFAETQNQINIHDVNGFGNTIRRIHEKELKKVAFVLEKGIRLKKIRKFNSYQLSVALGGLMDGFLFNWIGDPEKRPYSGHTTLIADVFFRGCLSTK